MMEKSGACPLCNTEVDYDDKNITNCPHCGIEIYVFVPIVRNTRSWFWELSPRAKKELCAAWIASRKEKS